MCDLFHKEAGVSLPITIPGRQVLVPAQGRFQMSATLRLAVAGVTTVLVMAGLIGCETAEKFSNFGRPDHLSRVADATDSTATPVFNTNDTSDFGGTSIGKLPPGRGESLERPVSFSSRGTRQGSGSRQGGS